ncbi:uncharacterized protein angptl8 [Scomber scombrus]|uniref:uncharacterized protein angptl8 n=1 Tax=Scomber scombrus TaxID=13677 RepID=UPI002DD8629B|nr:uncharacterized protein angptl8 [Scomber scombrus]
MIWCLILLCVAGAFRAVHAVPLRKTSKMEVKAAPNEEVNVLMFGVIQFSESLNYAFENTEAKIDKLSKTVTSREGALQQLEKQTEEAAEVEKQMKEVIQLLQAQMVNQQAQTMMTKDWLARIEQEETELKTKVKRMETYLNNALPSSIKELQERAEEHSSILKLLQHFTEFQKQNIETNDEQLSALQKMSDMS